MAKTRNRLTDLRCAWKKATTEQREAFMAQLGLERMGKALAKRELDTVRHAHADTVREERAAYETSTVMTDWAVAHKVLTALFQFGIDSQAKPGDVATELLESLAGPVAKALAALTEQRDEALEALRGISSRVSPVDHLNPQHDPEYMMMLAALKADHQTGAVREERAPYGKKPGYTKAGIPNSRMRGLLKRARKRVILKMDVESIPIGEWWRIMVDDGYLALSDDGRVFEVTPKAIQLLDGEDWLRA